MLKVLPEARLAQMFEKSDIWFKRSKKKTTPHSNERSSTNSQKKEVAKSIWNGTINRNKSDEKKKQFCINSSLKSLSIILEADKKGRENVIVRAMCKMCFHLTNVLQYIILISFESNSKLKRYEYYVHKRVSNVRSHTNVGQWTTINSLLFKRKKTNCIYCQWTRKKNYWP